MYIYVCVYVYISMFVLNKGYTQTHREMIMNYMLFLLYKYSNNQRPVMEADSHKGLDEITVKFIKQTSECG